ncbi:methyltransferase [bacterium]|nr:MAG: methyltransferase [bacterium]
MEEDWSGYWRENFCRLFRAGRFEVLPKWLDKAPDEGLLPIRIDPGMAFGGGDHPTTRLMLRLLCGLEERGLLPDEVLDVGSGTGILSIAAALLGAKRCEALDIDPFCMASAERNAALNGVAGKVTPLLLSLDLHGVLYRLVMANIVASQLEKLAPELKGRLAEGGILLLSGFTEDKKTIVREHFSPLRLAAESGEEGWAALALER